MTNCMLTGGRFRAQQRLKMARAAWNVCGSRRISRPLYFERRPFMNGSALLVQNKLRDGQKIFRHQLIERVISEFRSLETCANADAAELAAIKEQHQFRLDHIKFIESTVDGALGDVAMIGPE